MRASFIQIPIELLEDQAISPLELRLYCILMRYGMEGAGYSQAGCRFLARKLDVHPKTIAISLKNLQEAGYISITRVGLNRNDKIRCLKTIKREKKEKRMEPIHSIKKEPEHSLLQLYNIKNKRDRRLEPQNLEDFNPNISSTSPQTEETMTPLPEYHDETITPTTPAQTDETMTPLPEHQDEILEEINPHIPSTPAQTDETITPLPEYHDETNEILEEIKKNVRKTSFTDWFDRKIAISYSDSKRIEVNCVGDFKKKWLKDYYSSLIERISGKNVSIVEREKDEEKMVGQ